MWFGLWSIEVLWRCHTTNLLWEAIGLRWILQWDTLLRMVTTNRNFVSPWISRSIPFAIVFTLPKCVRRLLGYNWTEYDKNNSRRCCSFFRWHVRTGTEVYWIRFPHWVRRSHFILTITRHHQQSFPLQHQRLLVKNGRTAGCRCENSERKIATRNRFPVVLDTKFSCQFQAC